MFINAWEPVLRLQQVFFNLIFLPVNVNTLIFLWYFYKYFPSNLVRILPCVLCKRDASNKEIRSERPQAAIRNGCLFEWLFTRRICRLLDSLSGKEVDSGTEGRQNSFFFFQLKAVIYQECIPESETHRCKRKEDVSLGRGGWGRQGGEKEKQRLTNRWRWMDGWSRGPASLQWAEQMLRLVGWCHGSVCRLPGGCVFGGRGVAGRGGSQPCLPRGPPCLRRQEPSSVSRAIFTKAWKLLLLSLRLSCEGTRPTDTFTGDTAVTASRFTHAATERLTLAVGRTPSLDWLFAHLSGREQQI